METAASQDGTSLAFDRYGDGPVVIMVEGAFQHRAFDRRRADLAARLADRFSVFHYDRRGRGDSGDTPPYAVEREVEDLEALIEGAGGSASLYGSSSGGNLVLTALAHGLPARKVALWEPNFLVDNRRPRLPSDYVAQLEGRVASGRRGDAVEYFLTTGVGLPPQMVAPMRDTPMWAGMEAVAHTLAYDGRIVDGFTLRADELRSTTTPALVLAGGQTPWMTAGAVALAEALPTGEYRSPDGQGHDVAPEVMAAVLGDYFAV